MKSVQSANEGDRWARGKPELSEETVALLHAALDSPVTGRYPAWSASLKHAVKRIGIDARRAGWPQESLLVAFKSALHTLPSVRHLTSGAQGDEFVERLVSLCIDEYDDKPQRYLAAENSRGSHISPANVVRNHVTADRSTIAAVARGSRSRNAVTRKAK